MLPDRCFTWNLDRRSTALVSRETTAYSPPTEYGQPATRSNYSHLFSQLSAQNGRPPIWSRRVTDQDLAAGGEERQRQRDGVIWWAEAPRRHGVIRVSVGTLVTEILHVAGNHDGSLVEPEPLDGPPKEVRPLRTAIDERDAQVRAAPPDHQAGQAATRPEIDDGGGSTSDGVDEPQRVFDRVLDGERPDRPNSLTLPKGGQQWLEVSHPPTGARSPARRPPHQLAR
jgi:hypothetical protein